MRRDWWLVLALAVFSGAAGWYVGQRTHEPIRGADVEFEIGQPVPELHLPDLTGHPQALSQFAGQPLLINYWASWCGPCVEEMPRLNAAHLRRGSDGIAVLGVALEDDTDSVRAFATEHRLTLPIWIESPGRNDSSIRFGNRRSVLPFSVLIDADGRILARRAGAFGEAELRGWIERARTGG